MANSEPSSGEVFDVDWIRRLVDLMNEYDLREIDLRRAEQRIRLRRGGEPEPARFAPAHYASAQPLQPAQPPGAGQAAAIVESDGENIVYIKSPMVGTFYGRPNPKAEAYVKVGDHVDPETTVCIIEAMKVFNEIPAEVRGRVVAILVDDEEPVEFGKPLFKIDTSK